MEDPIFVAGRIVGLSLTRIPDNDEFVLKAVYEVEFQLGEPILTQQFFLLSQYELDAFLESVRLASQDPPSDAEE